MKYHLLFALDRLASAGALSERELAKRAGISRACLRQLKSGRHNLTLGSLCSLAEFFNRRVEVLVSTEECFPELSTVAVALKIERDGFESWKMHLMEFVDELRRAVDPRLIILPPHRGFDRKLTALMASLVLFLCDELGLEPPSWATKRYFLDSPWFVAGVESLKASAIQESPLAFRRNNIFVLANFAKRI